MGHQYQYTALKARRLQVRFFIDTILLSSLWPWFDSASNIHNYQEYFLGGIGGRCIGLTTLPPPCAYFLEIWEPQTPEALRARPGLYSHTKISAGLNYANLCHV